MDFGADFGLRAFFSFGLCGFGGVFSIRLSTSSRRSAVISSALGARFGMVVTYGRRP